MCQEILKWTTIFSNISNIGIFASCLYGIIRFLPNYKKQKRIENLSRQAENALTIIEEAKKAIYQLYLITKRTMANPFLSSNQKKHTQAQVKMLAILSKLRSVLLLIKSNQMLKKHLTIIQFSNLIEKLEKILHHKYQNNPKAFVTIDFLSELGLTDTPGFDDLKNIMEEIQIVLLKIYEFENQA